MKINPNQQIFFNKLSEIYNADLRGANHIKLVTAWGDAMEMRLAQGIKPLDSANGALATVLIDGMSNNMLPASECGGFIDWATNLLVKVWQHGKQLKIWTLANEAENAFQTERMELELAKAHERWHTQGKCDGEMQRVEIHLIAGPDGIRVVRADSEGTLS